MAIVEVEMFKVFLLVLARFSGLIVSAPVLGSANFPAIGKIGLAAMTALLMTPVVAASQTILPDDPIQFSLLAASEALIGLAIGFVMTFMFAAIQVAGQIMDMQTGFGLMNVFNPAFETQFPIFGFFFFIIALLYLLITNMHHLMIKALASTFDKIPLGGFVLKPELIWETSTWGTAIFYDGLVIAAPVAASMMLAYMTMGLLGRVVPQIHLFVVGFPVTIATGLIVVAFSIGLYLRLLDRLFIKMFNNVAVIIEGMS